VKIKQLEWHIVYQLKSHAQFISKFDKYMISMSNNNYYLTKRYECDVYEIIKDFGKFSTLEEAKQAAQQHFEQFIRSCIDE
jgi:hypothetical protein